MNWLDFIEKNGIQIWPQRKSKHGPVQCWWAQNTSPFFQTYGKTLPEALEKLKKAIEGHQWTKS